MMRQFKVAIVIECRSRMATSCNYKSLTFLKQPMKPILRERDKREVRYLEEIVLTHPILEEVAMFHNPDGETVEGSHDD